MKKILSISLIITLFYGTSFAQCSTNEVQVKVEIDTDTWGYETSWTLTNLSGSVLMQGGQGGVYGNNTSYTDSICITQNNCLIFEIFDTYGDGIFAPNGYALYLDNLLISSGSNDIQDYAVQTVNCPPANDLLIDALNDLQAHLNSAPILTTDELLYIRGIFNHFSDQLARSELIIELAKSLVQNYENQVGPLFTTANTLNGFSKDLAAAPGLELERAILALQQGIFDYVFTPQVYAAYPEHINGYQFKSCYNFPGYVDPPADSTLEILAIIPANFGDPHGINPYYNINGDGTEHALRPTGLYLSPGSVATIKVPPSLVGKDYYVRVGSHEWDLTNRPIFKRLDRISKKFPIDSTTIQVFNPLGGAISILVPYLANEGIVNITVTNGVEAPFFSLKTSYETPNFDAELNKPGPWAVFETDNVMFTIPKHAIIPGQYDLRQALIDWDTALQAVNSIMGRQIIPDKHNVYMIADITIRYGAYSIGYPLSNTPLNFTNVPGPAYFIDGPGPNDETNFHEYGHSLAMSKFPGETEALVNFPYIMAMNYGLNVALDQAVNYSFVPNTFDIDKSATHRMLSNSFGSQRDIADSTSNEVRYQHRGYAHYFEIVEMFGWCPLRNFWKQEFNDFENGIDHGTNNQNIDSRISRMSTAAQVDLRPLFHVFGIVPQDSIALQDTLNINNIQPSLILYNRLQEYSGLIPQDNQAFINYALFVYPNLYSDGPTENADYGVGWHYQKSLTYNAAEAQQRTTLLQGIIDRYFPNGQPPSNNTPDLCCILDTMNIIMINQEINVTGGVPPFEITSNTNGNVQTITVIDFDNCQSTKQFNITSVSQSITKGLRIFPNPAKSSVQIDFGTPQEQVTISAIDLSGKLIQTQTLASTRITNYQLPKAPGIYLLKITYQDGKYDSVRILKQ